MILILESSLETSENINIFKMPPKNFLLKKSQYSVDGRYTLMLGKTSGFLALVKTELSVFLWRLLYSSLCTGVQDSILNLRELLALLWKYSTASGVPSLASQPVRDDLSWKIYCYENCQIQESQDFQSRASQEVLSRSGSNYEKLCYT